MPDADREFPERFRVAFSYVSSERDVVRQVAKAVEDQLGHATVFLDEWFQHYIAGLGADLVLQEIYGSMAELVVVCASGAYDDRPWTLIEHDAIRARYMKGRRAEWARLAILPLRFGEGEIESMLFNAIIPDVRMSPPEKITALIVARYRQLARSLERASASAESAPARIDGAPAGRLLSLWLAGKNLSLGLLVKAHGADPGVVGRTLEHARANVRVLGLVFPRPPDVNSSSPADLARVLHYLIDAAGRGVVETVRTRFGETASAVFELAIKMPILVILYAPDAGESGFNVSFFSVMRRCLAEAGMPAEICGQVIESVRERRPHDEVKAEIFAAFDRIEEFFGSGGA